MERMTKVFIISIFLDTEAAAVLINPQKLSLQIEFHKLGKICL